MTPAAKEAGRREPIRARMKDDLVRRFRVFFPESPIDADPEWLAFVQSIEGKEVTLKFTCGDAFEEVDDNYWLPDCMWDEVRHD